MDKKLFSDLWGYLKAVFFETQQLVLTVLDIIGLLLLFFPGVADTIFVVQNQRLIQTVGLVTIFCSFLLANFLLYRRFSDQLSYQANIKLDAHNNELGVSTGSTDPFRELRHSEHGFNAEGMPDWAAFWANIRIRNLGREKGHLTWEVDRRRTNLPALFDLEKAVITFPGQISILARDERFEDFFYYIPFTTQNPYILAEAVRQLVNLKQGYHIVLRYQTVHVDGQSEVKRLIIKGDFRELRQKLLTHWNDYGFAQLIEVIQQT